MMYIRTKIGIFEKETPNKDNDFLVEDETRILTTGGGLINKKSIIKQSENLYELCDEFCYIKNGVVAQYLTIDFKFKRDDEFCTLKNKLTANGIAEVRKGISKYELENGELKFAIWTSKGLIYVAKMNDKGELELI